ncbi:S1C family serine protease [Candidatus Laterigemmans baculatus]|uniref:S1C family serine protease n=1 Tax=Candidatus Laterigemmans baculatus TaxID=2770505 RepID=UPI00193B0BE5|nr:trypsin-like peptidase domain-containing protein [Candidatus Laterigemmans baculatus]
MTDFAHRPPTDDPPAEPAAVEAAVVEAQAPDATAPDVAAPDAAAPVERPFARSLEPRPPVVTQRGTSSYRGTYANRGTSPLTQALITLLMLASTLGAARFLVPAIIEEARYAWRRGQLRAEYEGSEGALQNIGLDALSNAYQMVTQRVGASVVHIEVERSSDPQQTLHSIRLGGIQPPEMSDQGSGVIIDADGYILTNNHVIAGGDVITVGLSDGRRMSAEVLGSDPLTDVALLRVAATGLMPIEWGDSDQVEVGTPVWAVGSPFGLDRTVTFGILSGKHRAAKAGTTYQDFMQSDVAVNPGNSGGPLVDARGRLIGINTAIVGDTYRGVSFSIPSNVARRVVERLRSSGRFDRGWLGVQLAEVPDELLPGEDFRLRGALVSRLADPDSPAAQAGIAAGDIIVGFDGNQIADMGALMRMVGNWPAGQTAEIEIFRDGTRRTLAVEIGARPMEFSVR